MKKRYQVFVSSTYMDLIEERQEVMHALLRADCIPAGMELFPAADEQQWSVIKRAIDECDYYVLIMAGKYGSEYKNKSYTQREYEYAIQKKKSVIAFLHRDLGSLPASKVERTEEKQEKLEKFRKLVEKRLCDFWTNKHDLATALYNAIESLKHNSPKDGWIRATRHNLAKISEKRNKNLREKSERLQRKVDTLEKKLEEKVSETQINYDSNADVKASLSAKIVVIDTKINSVFPSKLHSPTTKDHVPFSSQRLINSLSTMGIPLDAILDVLDLAAPELVALKRRVSQLSTSHIRKAISYALYKLDAEEYSETQIQSWGDSYVRKYGNPDRRVTVIQDDGEMIPLTYSYLKSHLIPDMISCILGDHKSDSCVNASPSHEVNHMGEEIMNYVRGLNLYRIHYSTLIKLSSDLALQPPHPWIVTKPFDFDTVAYDYDRALDHKYRIERMMTSEEIKEGKYSAKECLHHSCSGILALYGVYMGCGYLAPFHNLRYHLRSTCAGKTTEVNEYSSFARIKDDMTFQEGGVRKLFNQLEEIKDGLNNLSETYNEKAALTSNLIVEVFITFKTLYALYSPDGAYE